MKYFTLFVSALLLIAPCTPAMAQAPRGIGVFDGADADKDGRTSRTEFIAARDRQFDRLDRNNDGVVSRDDFKRLSRFRPKLGERLDRWTAAADADHDGKVTREELHNAPAPLFDRADANHDGYVDQDELRALRSRTDGKD